MLNLMATRCVKEVETVWNVSASVSASLKSFFSANVLLKNQTSHKTLLQMFLLLHTFYFYKLLLLLEQLPFKPVVAILKKILLDLKYFV